MTRGAHHGCKQITFTLLLNKYILTLTDLRKYEERGELTHPVIFTSLVLISVMLYFTVSLMDPGFVLSDTEVIISGHL